MEKIKTLEELREELTSLGVRIREIQQACAYHDDDELHTLCLAQNMGADKVNIWNQADETFLRMELSGILYKLNQALNNIDYINGKLKAVGRLRKMASGRYALSDWEDLCSGDALEVLVEDDYHGISTENGVFLRIPYWRAGLIAHNGTDFYFIRRPDLPLEGQVARIRR